MNNTIRHIIELKELAIGYTSHKEGKTILQAISASIQRGELVGLIGNNGIGKSTLLKTIDGQLKPISGTIQLNEQPLDTYASDALAKTIAVVLTEKITGFSLTVTDVVASGRIPYLGTLGSLSVEDKHIINECMEVCGVTPFSHKYMDELSDGMRQKAMIAKALAQQTDVVLLDEPTAFLDFTSKHAAFQLLQKLCRQGQKTMIISSHDIELLLHYCDKVLLLDATNQHHFDKPANIINSTSFKEMTGGFKFQLNNTTL